MSKLLQILGLMLFVLFFVAGCQQEGGYQLVWSDEFEDGKLDLESWEPMIGDGSQHGIPGWGNNELQYYTGRDENVVVEDGNLILLGREEKYNYKGHKYTSARLRTAGKRDFLYGKMEARVKLPSGQGMWPAFWMMPTDSEYGRWPLSGEIDILESINVAPDVIMGSIFFGDAWPGVDHVSRHSWKWHGANEVDLSQEYHVYGIEWQPYEIRWYVDDVVYSVANEWRSGGGNYPAPFDKQFHFLLNIAVGGNGPGAPDASTPWPQRMFVDWVRAYQIDNQPPEVAIISPVDGEVIRGGESMVIKVEAYDSDGSIRRVEFYGDGELLGADRSRPYRYEWDVEDGCYDVKVRVYDDDDFVNFDAVKVSRGVGCP